ncbi:competence protein TfoX [Armatimonadetes bacterium Uphvl-Ar1]|nr:competence protein TfoX [Armatimonadetes bacterium Uphvl-Ar1]
MPSDLNFVEHVSDQINRSGRVSFKKMFGEYALYYDEKVVGLVCDNQLYLKPTPGGRSMIGEVIEAPPYPGAKPHFLIGEQLDDPIWMSSLIELTAAELPNPKPKKSKSKH